MTDQVRIRREKLAALQQEGRDPFQQTKYTVTSDAAAIKADFAGMEGRDVSLAGRIMSKRGMGKVHLLRPAGSTPAASSSTSS